MITDPAEQKEVFQNPIKWGRKLKVWFHDRKPLILPLNPELVKPITIKPFVKKWIYLDPVLLNLCTKMKEKRVYIVTTQASSLYFGAIAIKGACDHSTLYKAAQILKDYSCEKERLYGALYHPKINQHIKSIKARIPLEAVNRYKGYAVLGKQLGNCI